jgi:hypothetical protein
MQSHMYLSSFVKCVDCVAHTSKQRIRQWHIFHVKQRIMCLCILKRIIRCCNVNPGFPQFNYFLEYFIQYNAAEKEEVFLHEGRCNSLWWITANQNILHLCSQYITRPNEFVHIHMTLGSSWIRGACYLRNRCKEAIPSNWSCLRYFIVLVCNFIPSLCQGWYQNKAPIQVLLDCSWWNQTKA